MFWCEVSMGIYTHCLYLTQPTCSSKYSKTCKNTQRRYMGKYLAGGPDAWTGCAEVYTS